MVKKLVPVLAAMATLSGCMVLDEPVVVRGEILASPVIVVRDEPHVIVLPERGAFYRSLQFEVEGAPVIVYRIVIEYSSGEREVRDVHWAFGSGRVVEAVRLSGDRRVVRNVTVYTRPENGRAAGTATIRVRGLS